METVKSKRLEILEKSLAKKEARFSESLDAHIGDVKRANGQPLNDKRNGHVTLNRWERQNDSLRNKNKDIEKTKAAIERESSKIAGVDHIRGMLPAEIVALIEAGDLTQWRKHPNILFVSGVDKARIVWDLKAKKVMHKYASAVTDQEQRSKFARIYNSLHTALNG